MNIPARILPPDWLPVAWGLWVVVFAIAVWRAPWKDLHAPLRFNVWLGTIVFLTLIWSLRAGVRPGLELHLLGAALFLLCFGPWLAYVGLCAVLLGVTINGGADPAAYAVNALMTGGTGVLVSHLLLRVGDRFLPPHPFVFVFFNGFFGAGCSVLAVGFASTLLLAGAGIYPADYLFDEYLPYYLLLGFSEAWLTGMIVTLLVIYRPAWIASFDDKRYLHNN